MWKITNYRRPNNLQKVEGGYYSAEAQSRPIRGKFLFRIRRQYLSRLMTKPTKWLCAQRRLRSAWASAQSDQSTLCAHWVAKDPRFLHADSEYSDQTRLIWVFAGRTSILLVLSWGGSFLSCIRFTVSLPESRFSCLPLKTVNSMKTLRPLSVCFRIVVLYAMCFNFITNNLKAHAMGWSWDTINKFCFSFI